MKIRGQAVYLLEERLERLSCLNEKTGCIEWTSTKKNEFLCGFAAGLAEGYELEIKNVLENTGLTIEMLEQAGALNTSCLLIKA